MVTAGNRGNVMDAMWMPIQQLVDIVYPRRPGGRALRWGLHLAFWSLLIVILWQVNHWGGLERMLRSPWPRLHHVWLPLLAVALYPLGWLGIGLWRSLRLEPVGDVVPQVESTWHALTAALQKIDVDASRAPTFLILGAVSTELRSLLAEQGAKNLPMRGDAPIQVFAHADAIFIATNRAQAMLQSFCNLLCRERATQALQGIVIGVPFDADVDGDFASTCRDELRVVRQTTGQEVPIYFVVSGLERGPIEPDAWLQRFPPLPDLDPAEIASMYRAGVDWLCLEHVPRQIRPLLRCDVAALADNLRLYERLVAMEAWRTRFVKIIMQTTQTDAAEPGMVAGCYMLPSTAVAATFAGDLLRHKDTACWTAETLARATAQRRRVRLGYATGLCAMATIFIGIVSWMILR
jgi:hypothetical protein